MTDYALHPGAFTDIDQLWDYIATDSLDAADRTVDDIFTVLGTLAASPHIGHRRPDLTTRPLRFHRVRDYLIAYAPEEQPLWIIAVIHGRRDPRIIAAILRSRPETTD